MTLPQPATPTPQPSTHPTNPHRPRQYELAWYGLTAICALIDVVCFVALGGVFASMMTGNLLLLAVSVGKGAGWVELGRQVLPVLTFMVGAVLGGRLMRLPGRFPGRFQDWRLGFALEWVFLVAATLLVWLDHPTDTNAVGQVVVALLGLSMGVHGAMVHGHGVPDLASNVMTTTLATFMSDTRAAGGASKHWQRRGGSILVFFVAGVAGAGLMALGGMIAPLVAACVILTLALYSLMTAAPPPD
ncbi:MAG: YoaK family protein [Pigmentiphaga sp.]